MPISQIEFLLEIFCFLQMNEKNYCVRMNMNIRTDRHLDIKLSKCSLDERDNHGVPCAHRYVNIGLLSSVFIFVLRLALFSAKMIASKVIRKILLANLSSNLKSVRIVHNTNKYTTCLGVFNFKCEQTNRNACPTVYYTPVGQTRFYTNADRKEFNVKFKTSKQKITDNIELKRLQMRERKEIMVQGIRDKKIKVQEKVREMEEFVERENILTIPNLLCVARSILAPYIGYVIIQGSYPLAIGLLVVAGITDLVRIAII